MWDELVSGRPPLVSGALGDTLAPRSRQGGLVRPQHAFNALEIADHVTRACAWSDGGCEFIYSDGTVLSFTNDMSSFVAIRYVGSSPSSSLAVKQPPSKNISASTRATEEAAASATLQARYSDEEEEGVQRDMCFTAWTLSKYTRKVTAALEVYNHYSSTPRLIAGLTRQEVSIWRESSPMDVLVLAQDASLLEKRTVWYRVAVACEGEGGGSNDIKETLKMDRQGEGNESCHQNYCYSNGVDEGMSSILAMNGGRVLADVASGTEVTFQCALRRVSLTLHANGVTFSVRWPAPVTQPSGTQSIFTSQSSTQHSAAAAAGRGYVSPSAALLALRKATQFVWVEQTFPRARPPPEWVPMLQMALELSRSRVGEEEHEEEEDTALASKGEGIVQEGSRSATPGAAGAEALESSEDSAPCQEGKTLYGTLPKTADNRNQQNCSFSRMKVSHAQQLLASSSALHTAACNREIHGVTARVLWRYDADCTGREPHAMYWCLEGTCGNAMGVKMNEEHAMERKPQESTAETQEAFDFTTTTLAVVREDESIVSAAPLGDGYMVRHARVDGSVRVYHTKHLVSDTRSSRGVNDGGFYGSSGSTASELPPVVGPLCFAHVSRAAPLCTSSSSLHNGDSTRTGTASLLVHSADLVLSFLEDRSGGFAVEPRGGMSLPFLDSTGRELTDAPFFASYTQGRYLRFVGECAMQLSRCNRAAARAEQQQRLLKATPLHSSTSLSWSAAATAAGGGGGAHTYLRPHPLAEEQDTLLAESVDASAYRICASDSLGALSTAARDGSVVYLTTRLGGIGTFTALTNGTIRCQFDDRTILHLIPGVSDFDEVNLVASCLFRNATRCCMRAVQCGPGHDMFRYLAYALPFRRFVLSEAAEASAAAAQVVGKENHRHNHFDTVTEEPGKTGPFIVNQSSCEVREDDQRHCDREHRNLAVAAASGALSGSVGRVHHESDDLADAGDSSPTVQPPDGCYTDVAKPPCYSLRVMTWEETMRARDNEEKAALLLRAEHIDLLLSINDELSQENRSVLHDDYD